MILDDFVRKMVNGLSLVLTVLALSGCATKQLKNDIKDHENGRALYSNDVITAATIIESGKENYSWVFIGNNFDYALTSGASDFYAHWCLVKLIRPGSGYLKMVHSC